MKFLKKLSIFLAIFIIACSITTISATNVNDTVTYDENISYDNLESISTNFTTLQKNIDENNEIILNNDIQRTNGEKDININKTTTIDGQGKTIDANGLGRIFNVQSTGILTLKNINLLNGNGTNDFYGGAIYINGGSVDVINSTFNNNTINSGAAIFVQGGTLNVTNSVFSNNTAVWDSGAIRVCGGSNVTITNSIFINNTANSGGAIYVYEGRVSVIQSKFNKNKANVDGGAIYINDQGTINITNSEFNENIVTGYNGGAICVFRGNISVNNSTFNKNSANQSGAIFLRGVNATIINSTFNNNNNASQGSAIFVYNSSIPTDESIIDITSSIFINNDINGVNSVYINPILDILVNNQKIATVGLKDNFNLTATLTDNKNNIYYSTGLTYTLFNGKESVKSIKANELFNAISNMETAGSYIVSGNYTGINNITNLTINNATLNVNGSIRNNDFKSLNDLINNCNGTLTLYHDYKMYSDEVTTYSLGININKNIIIDGNGYTIDANGLGRIFKINTGSFALKNINLLNGNSYDGGAIYISYSDVNITNSKFSNNYASHCGGVIYIGGNSGNYINITDSEFDNNSAEFGGAIMDRYYGGTINVDKTLFCKNSALDHGGVIFLEADSSIHINSSIFKDNSANVGGAISARSDTYIVDIKVSNSTFNNNSANTGGAIGTEGNSTTTLNNSTFNNNSANTGSAIDGCENDIITSSLFINNNIQGVNSVYKNSILNILVNNQKIATVGLNDNFNLTATLTDNKNNIYYSTGLTYKLFKGKESVKSIKANELFNAISNMETAGSYIVSGNYNGINNITSLTINNATLNVNGSIRNNDFKSLNDLINNCNGTLILSHDYMMYSDEVTTYSTGILINKNIVIDGNGYTIDAKGLGRIFNVYSGSLTLKNINLINGNSNEGGAIYVFYSPITIINSTFSNNSASYRGGVIFVQESNKPIYITNSSFNNNSAEYGGVIMDCYNGGSISVTNSIFSNNSATNTGSAIFLEALCNLNVNSSIFKDNSAIYKGAIAVREGIINVTDSTFNNNIGGSICSDGNSTTLGCTFYNTISNNAEIYLSSGYNFLKGNTFKLKDNVPHIELTNGYIVSPVTATVMDNKTVDVPQLQKYNIKVVFTDDNGNIIRINNNEVANVIINESTYNLNDNITSSYCIYKPKESGIYSVSASSYLLTNLAVKKGTLNVSPNLYELNLQSLKKYVGAEDKLTATLTYDGNPCSNENIEFIINGKSYIRTTNSDGQAFLSVNFKTPGNYSVTANYNNRCTDNTIVTILSTIESSNLVKFYKNSTQYYAKFFDSKGNPLLYTPITFNINGVFYTRVTDGFGVAGLKINLNSGTYIITSINPVTGEQKGNNVTILSSITSPDVTLYYKNGTKYTATFYASEGVPLTNAKVSFNINGVLYERTTDTNGIATLNINLNPDKYTITAINNLNGEMIGSTVNVLPVLVGNDMDFTYGESKYYTVKALDGQGKPVSNQKIEMNINGVFYTKTTDSNGEAKLNIRLNPGDYIITSYWNTAVTSNTIKIRG